MSYRYPAAFIKPGLNTLVNGTPTYTYGLWSWGSNAYGELNLGNTTYYSSPKQVGALTDWLNIGGMYRFSASVKTDGTLWTCGENNFGQLGQGNTTIRSSPVQVGSLTNWSQTACGTYHALAIKTDGTLWAWGYNTNGQLGQGNTTNRSSPVQVGALTTWTYVFAGNNASFGILSDNTLWCWGSNQDLQLPLGGGTVGQSFSSPQQVGTLTNWLSVSTRYKSVVAVKTNGTLWCWGRNNEGQLGRGNTSNYYSPVQVGALTTWKSCSSGRVYTVATKTDGTFWSWGDNTYGQLGLGTSGAYTGRSSPVQVGALTNWGSAICTQNSSTLAIKTDGTLWSWGSNGSGQLGLNNTTNYSSPMQVGSGTTWAKIIAMANSTLALKY